MEDSIKDERDLKDGELLYFLVIPSSPATKKNSNRIIRVKGFMKVIPSERFMKYQKFCEPYFAPLRKDKQPIDFGVSIKIRVATDKWIVPDYTNVCQALGDILQHYGVLENDKWIHWTDGIVIDNIPSEHWFLGVDKKNPRIEIEIRRFRHPLEQYETDKQKKEELKAQKRKQNVLNKDE